MRDRQVLREPVFHERMIDAGAIGFRDIAVAVVGDQNHRVFQPRHDGGEEGLDQIGIDEDRASRAKRAPVRRIDRAIRVDDDRNHIRAGFMEAHALVRRDRDVGDRLQSLSRNHVVRSHDGSAPHTITMAGNFRNARAVRPRLQ
jgi:hypothetical protein